MLVRSTFFGQNADLTSGLQCSQTKELDKVLRTCFSNFLPNTCLYLAHEVVEPVVHAGEDVDGLLVVVQSKTDAGVLWKGEISH